MRRTPRLSILAFLFLPASLCSQQKTETIASGADAVSKQHDVQSARLIKKVSPEYPKKARKQHVEGTVRLHAIIAKDGSVKDLEIVSGDPLLVDAALKAVRQWRYEPTLWDGRPVEVDTTIDVKFALNQNP